MLQLVYTCTLHVHAVQQYNSYMKQQDITCNSLSGRRMISYIHVYQNVDQSHT